MMGMAVVERGRRTLDDVVAGHCRRARIGATTLDGISK